MEKRFKNILIRSEKRNGAMVSMCAVCLTVVSGMLVGCSAAGNISSGVQAQTQFETDSAETDSADAVTENLPDTPADSEQITNIVKRFADAYFSGDINAVKSLLPDSYAWDADVYEGAGTISDIALKGLPDAGEQPVGSVLTVSMQYRDSAYEDMFQYLTFEFVRQDAGWEIQFYGTEG